ncbi:MAG: SelB domain-containing protein, partial [Nocardioidaceae bacterium]
ALPLGRPGLSPAAVCRLLDLPDPALVPPLVRAPLAMLDGRVALRAAPVLTPRQAAARDRLRRELAGTAVGAPEAGRLAALGLDPETVAALHRAGEVLRLEDNVVTLPEAVPAALSVLRGLPQPFTTSEARRALGTTRRVALPLLAHLDRTGRTVRLADDRRRLREGGVG